MSEEILELNHIDYNTPKILNPSKMTEKIDIPVNPNRYDECVGGEQIPIIFNNLKSCCFIDGSKSTLSLQIQVDIPPPVSSTDPAFIHFDIDRRYDSGATVLNVFSEAVHQTSNNQILYRENFINMMQTFRNFRISPEHRQNLTMVGGSPPEISFAQIKYPIYPVNKPISFDIPFSLIAPFWNTAQLIPSELLQNSSLFLKVASPLSFIKCLDINGNYSPMPESVTISFMNIALRLHRTELYDNIQSAIKSSQLEFSYLSNFNLLYTPTSNNFVIPINLAASKVSYVAIKFFRRFNNLSNSSIACSDIFQLTGGNSDDNSMGFSIQAKVGEMLVPRFKIDTAVQAYVETCDALDRVPFKNTENPDPLKVINQLSSGTVPYNNYCFNAPVAPGTYLPGDSTGCFCIAINLEKYGGLSGLSTNANRLLALHIDGLTNYEDYEAYVQVQYMSNVSMVENNIIVSK
jgi:hypothetical protein